MNKENYLTTGQLAKRTGITVRTLRYYDQIVDVYGAIREGLYGENLSLLRQL
ncbi:MerR family DNA-binding transcriptional regulator [Paenibacillus sp. P3E]|uniref:MerR family DNA-binding transcriptional regulator n=1 Tax=Paenibacillus sp. P3E TaxID=1349435 RepID=UPI000A5F162C|nr:MerR family DNA-binding transcriptional regulator [Paenibacillus sp. P3E]